MYRTQIYLPDDLRHELDRISSQTGESLSEAIRRLLKSAIAKARPKEISEKERIERALKNAFGSWRNNATDFQEIRRSADRNFPGWDAK